MKMYYYNSDGKLKEVDALYNLEHERYTPSNVVECGVTAVMWVEGIEKFILYKTPEEASIKYLEDLCQRRSQDHR